MLSQTSWQCEMAGGQLTSCRSARRSVAAANAPGTCHLASQPCHMALPRTLLSSTGNYFSGTLLPTITRPALGAPLELCPQLLRQQGAHSGPGSPQASWDCPPPCPLALSWSGNIPWGSSSSTAISSTLHPRGSISTFSSCSRCCERSRDASVAIQAQLHVKWMHSTDRRRRKHRRSCVEMHRHAIRR